AGSFQPSRIGLGSMRGAPRPAGRISNSRWGASAVVLPMWPIVVPPRTLAPLTSFLATKSFGFRPSGAVVEATSAAGVLRASCAAPPAALALARVGWAKRRTFASAATGAGVAVGAGCAETRRASVRVLLVAGDVGA